MWYLRIKGFKDTKYSMVSIFWLVWRNCKKNMKTLKLLPLRIYLEKANKNVEFISSPSSSLTANWYPYCTLLHGLPLPSYSALPPPVPFSKLFCPFHDHLYLNTPLSLVSISPNVYPGWRKCPAPLVLYFRNLVKVRFAKSS